MSFMSSPQLVAAKPEPPPDPALVAQREAAKAAAESSARQTGERARRDFMGRTMGTQGANAFFTSGAAGYGRTMGAANI